MDQTNKEELIQKVYDLSKTKDPELNIFIKRLQRVTNRIEQVISISK